MLSSILWLSALAILVEAQTKYSLPIGNANTTARAASIQAIRANFTYGPDIVGGGPYFPQGSYANQLIQLDSGEFFPEQQAWVANVTAESQAAAAAVGSSIKTFNDYKKLYYNQWNKTIPTGPDQGMLSNGTSDLLFAMERLSTQPYSVARVAANAQLAFTIPDATAIKISTLSQSALHSAGRLFYVDYRDQANQTLTAGRYAAASDAFFFIHPVSGDFLPLAIRPNNGSPLIYTPLDSANDWQLAKLLFNSNDLWWGQWYHLIATHEISDLVFAAAVRTLSKQHPVYALMRRLAYQTYAFRISAIKTLINPGGPVDQFFPWRGSAAGAYTAKLYGETAGAWQGNYFLTNFRNRGLINSTFGPELKSIPFFDDASRVSTTLRTFLSSALRSYYTSNAVLAQDKEIQNFMLEAGPAKIIDFPAAPLSDIDTLVDILTHFGYLVSVLHGTLNGNDPVLSTAVLPFHPAAFYQPLPQQKGVKDLFPFMPNVTQSVGQILLLGAFNRPFFAGGNRTLSQMWSDETLLSGFNSATVGAAGVFESAMNTFSKEVSGRKFDDQGLSQGMPFIWKVLDPNGSSLNHQGPVSYACNQRQ